MTNVRNNIANLEKPSTYPHQINGDCTSRIRSIPPKYKQSISPINIEISFAVKTPARMNENNASSRTIGIPFPKQAPQGYRINTSKNEKALVPCPFLKRKGHCLKGLRCDFLHKNVLPAVCGPKIQQGNHSKPQHHDKSRIPCPFLRRNGFCLKDDRCDFYHHSGSNNMFALQCPQNPTGHAPTLYPPQLNFDQSPFPADRRHFPPFQLPAYYPFLRSFPYPPPLPYSPPLMSTSTRPLTRPRINF